MSRLVTLALALLFCGVEARMMGDVARRAGTKFGGAVGGLAAAQMTGREEDPADFLLLGALPVFDEPIFASKQRVRRTKKHVEKAVKPTKKLTEAVHYNMLFLHG